MLIPGKQTTNVSDRRTVHTDRRWHLRRFQLREYHQPTLYRILCLCNTLAIITQSCLLHDTQHLETGHRQSHLGRACCQRSRQRMDSPAACVSCPLQTSPIIQPRVCYIHTAVPHASYKLHCTVHSPHPQEERNLFLP